MIGTREDPHPGRMADLPAGRRVRRPEAFAIAAGTRVGLGRGRANGHRILAHGDGRPWEER